MRESYYRLNASSVAEVAITLKNQGPKAYKPEDYGESIVIKRRFTKGEPSTWGIGNKAGKIVATKQEEVSAIRNHMNIQVDNPMNVIAQGDSFLIFFGSLLFTFVLKYALVDPARQFLGGASTPAENYKVSVIALLCVK